MAVNTTEAECLYIFCRTTKSTYTVMNETPKTKDDAGAVLGGSPCSTIFMTTETPRTDEAATFRPNDDGMTDFVPAEFARSLERELDEVKSHLDAQSVNDSVVIGMLRQENIHFRERLQKLQSDLWQRALGWATTNAPCERELIGASKAIENILSNVSDQGHLPGKQDSQSTQRSSG
jgi:hypothetical protein